MIRKTGLYIWVIVFGLIQSESWAQNRTVNIEIDFTDIIRQSNYQAGLTHTQHSINSWGNTAAIENAKALLDSATHFQNQHIMGWGALNPWPDSTVVNSENWDWESLDSRVELINETNGVAVLTLCACPTWMHSPTKNGQTDWSEIEKAPTIDHYDDFAHLCAVVARRYPEVKYYQVWNEFKGFYYPNENRWNYENYTKLYNLVYDSLKAVNNELQIGGPYITMDSWSSSSFSHPSNVKGDYGVLDRRPLDVISYWLEHKNGADFITIDGGNSNKDGVWKADGFKASKKFVDVIEWIRQQPNGGKLSVWWAEWYAWTENNSLEKNEAYLNAIMTNGLAESIKAGYSNLMIWQPQGDQQGFSFPLGIWTDTGVYGGGQPTLFYESQKKLKNYFSEEVSIYRCSLSESNIINVMATDNAIMLVNQLNEQVQVKIQGLSGNTLLDPYQVRFLIDVNITTSFNQLRPAINGNVFPNPFSDQLFIKVDNSNLKNLIIEIYNMAGNLVYSKQYGNSSFENSLLTINTHDLSQGTYLLNIFDDQHNARSSTLIIKN